MKAALRDRYGSPDVIEMRDVDVPQPSGDEILVKLQAASVNRADLDALYAKPWVTRFAYGMVRPRSPRLGADAAGVVEAVGPTATRFAVGDRVFADLFVHGMGSFAEYAVRPRDRVRTDPGRHVVRGRRDPPALGHPRPPGAPAAATAASSPATGS